MKRIQKKIISFFADKGFSEILSGSIWAFVAQCGSALILMLISIITAKYYGPQILGIVAILNSVLLFSSIISLMGTGTSILRLVPQHLISHSMSSAFNIYKNIQLLVTVLSVIIGLLLCFNSNIIATKIFSKPFLAPYLFGVSFFVLFKSLMTLNTQAVRGMKLIKLYSLLQILPASINLLILSVATFTFSILQTKETPVFAFLSAIFFTAIVGITIMYANYFKRRSDFDKIEKTSIKKILTISSPMLLTSSMIFVNAQMGTIALGMFGKTADVGFYTVAVKLATLTSFILHAINSISAPKFSELYFAKNHDELFRVAQKSTKLIFYITTPILILLLCFGKSLLSFFYGENFTIAYFALSMLVIGQFFHSISGSTGIFLNMTGHQIVLRNIMLLTAILNIILNFILTPKFGISGAAFCAMFCTMFWNLLATVVIKKEFHKFIFYFPGMKAFIG